MHNKTNNKTWAWLAKTQISLHTCAVWSVFPDSLRAIQWGLKENPCHIGWMYRLIGVFAGYTGLIVRFVVCWLRHKRHMPWPGLEQMQGDLDRTDCCACWSKALRTAWSHSLIRTFVVHFQNHWILQNKLTMPWPDCALSPGWTRPF